MACLENTFRVYSKGTSEIDNRAFVKWLKDTKVINSKFNVTDADLLFAKFKSKTTKKLNLNKLDEAIKVIAQRRDTEEAEITHLLESSSGPEFKGTKADPIKFHDDKSLYTGVHQHGGPSTVDKGRTLVADLSDIADRSTYNIRGVSSKIQEKVDKI